MMIIRNRDRRHIRFALTSMELYQAWSTVEFNANADAIRSHLAEIYGVNPEADIETLSVTCPINADALNMAADALRNARKRSVDRFSYEDAKNALQVYFDLRNARQNIHK